MGTIATADGKHVYVSTGRSKMVLAVSTATDSVVGSIEAGQRPWGLALSKEGTTLYSANGPGNDVSVIDLSPAMQIRQRIAVGRGPWGVALVARP